MKKLHKRNKKQQDTFWNSVELDWETYLEDVFGEEHSINDYLITNCMNENGEMETIIWDTYSNITLPIRYKKNLMELTKKKKKI